MAELISYWEHCNQYNSKLQGLSDDTSLFFKGDRDKCCIQARVNGEGALLSASYYIGVDWIHPEYPVYIAPKLNRESAQINYLSMLMSCLNHPDILEHTDDLFEIKFDDPHIEIEQKQDMLSPLLIVQFLQTLQSIVRKGLKKSYYRVEQNLQSRVKGKVMVSQTIKKNVLQNKPLKTYCCYDEFGVNGVENRLLKKALLFVQRYLASHKELNMGTRHIMAYCLPAFEDVSDDIEIGTIKNTSPNAFYREYKEGIRLAKLILKRFGYNIHTMDRNEKVKTPPFWIDMSLLFELYVLGLLKDRYGNEVKFQFQANYGRPDYLLKNMQMVVDAKYKPYYTYGFKGNKKRHEMAADIRQLSCYARDKKVLSTLGLSEDDQRSFIADCLIIYPDQGDGVEDLMNVDLKGKEIEQFVGFYKLGVRLPIIGTSG